MCTNQNPSRKGTSLNSWRSPPMEDDDEFGDLYTDVLRPFSSSSAPSEPHQSSSNPASFGHSIDLNAHSDVDDFLCAAPKSNSVQTINQPQVPEVHKPPLESGPARSRDSGRNFGGGDVLVDQGLGKGGYFVGDSKNWAASSLELGGSRVLESGDVKLPDAAPEEGESGGDAGKGGGGDKDAAFMEKDVNFDIEEVDGEAGDVGLDPIIPGISAAPSRTTLDASVQAQNRGNVVARDDASVQGDDWDSDSEDDLQIVLNDNNQGPMATERNEGIGSDDEDEDGDPLVIVADGDQTHPPPEEQEWGEDGAADGERKEGAADAAKVNGTIAGPAKIGYSSHGYHPFHSQFKVSYIYAV